MDRRLNSMNSMNSRLNYDLCTSELKYIFVFGNSGIGKTIISTAMGIFLSKMNFKVLIITKNRIKLEKYFEQKIKEKEITNIKKFKNLFVIENYENNRINKKIKNYIDLKLNMFIEKTYSLHGKTECLKYLQFINYLEKLEFDKIIFDISTKSYIPNIVSAPLDLEIFFGEMIGIKNESTKIFDQISPLIEEFGLGNRSEVLKNLTNLKKVVENFGKKLENSRITTAICVSYLETSSIEELENNLKLMANHNLCCGMIMFNKVINGSQIFMNKNLFKKIKDNKRYLMIAKEILRGFPIIEIPFFEYFVKHNDKEKVNEIKKVLKIADFLYRQKDIKKIKNGVK